MVQHKDGSWRRFTMGQFEAIYQAWLQGGVTTEAIRRRHGVDWLARTWGKEGIWDYLHRVLDVIPDAVAAIWPPGAQFMEPDNLHLPLKVPWSALREVLQAWVTGRMTEEQVSGKYGEEWMRLLRKIRAEGIDKHRGSMEVVVYWDIPPELPREWHQSVRE